MYTFFLFLFSFVPFFYQISFDLCCSPGKSHTQQHASRPLRSKVRETDRFGGDHDTVKPQFFHPPGALDVWVDNLRFIGENKEVTKWEEMVEARASQCQIIFKPSATLSQVKKYTFIGVEFDHTKRSVRPAQKIVDKLIDLEETVSCYLMRLLKVNTIAANQS